MTRLEIAEGKLARLERELDETIQADVTHFSQTNGQPMNDKRNGGTFFKRAEQIQNKIFRLKDEIAVQKERIEKLYRQDWLKRNHRTASGGLQTSVHNIEIFKSRKQDKKTRAKVALLEEMVEAEKQNEHIMTARARALVTFGKVSKWDKKPIYYFVAGLRKVALVVDKKTGDFILSKAYPCKNGSDELFINKLLKGE